MKKQDLNNRIWELDFIRGIAIICVLLVHIPVFNIKFAGADISLSPFISFVIKYGGAFFILLSGFCISFSKDSFKRGIAVIIGGFILTIASGTVYELGYETEEVLMQWNILEMIGLCMLLYPYMKKLPNVVTLVWGVIIIIAGYYITEHVTVTNPNLYALGFKTANFVAFEWRPILPNLGWFMLGVGLRPFIYKERKSLIPQITEATPVVNVFCAIGRNTLIIYIVHMLVYYVIFRFLI